MLTLFKRLAWKMMKFHISQAWSRQTAEKQTLIKSQNTAQAA
jgi:hypothetical protein